MLPHTTSAVSAFPEDDVGRPTHFASQTGVGTTGSFLCSNAGETFDDVFVEFDDEPLGAASVAQVIYRYTDTHRMYVVGIKVVAQELLLPGETFDDVRVTRSI